MSAPTPDPDAFEREVLAKFLYDAEGFHAADHWGVETPIMQGRYEALADALLAAGWTRSPRPAAVSEEAIRADERAKVAERIEGIAVRGDVISREYGCAIRRQAAALARTAPAEDGAE